MKKKTSSFLKLKKKFSNYKILIAKPKISIKTHGLVTVVIYDFTC